MVIPDVNLLVYAYNSGSPFHKPAERWFSELMSSGVEVGFPWTVVFGFVRLLSTRSIFEHAVSPAHSCKLVRDWLGMPGAAILDPGPRHLEIFEGLIDSARGGPKLVTDAHLAAMAIEYKAELHSNDVDFGRFKKLNWVNPM